MPSSAQTFHSWGRLSHRPLQCLPIHSLVSKGQTYRVAYTLYNVMKAGIYTVASELEPSVRHGEEVALFDARRLTASEREAVYPGVAEARSRPQATSGERAITESKMNPINAGFKLGEAMVSLASKVFGSSLSIQWQANAESKAELQAALTSQIATRIAESPDNPELLDAIISYGGKANLTNLAKILQKATLQLNEGATPTRITDDWIANFKDRARTCSDEQMADLWAQLLAGEANAPGSYSRKAVNILADLQKEDAELFSTLCRYRLIIFNPFANLLIEGSPEAPLSRFNTPREYPMLGIMDIQHQIYTENGINFQAVGHLAGLGLISVQPMGIQVSPKAAYRCGGRILVLLGDKPIPLGIAQFTTAGAQLSQLCSPLETPDGFHEYLTDFWQSHGISVSNDINEVMTFTSTTYTQDPETGEWVDQETGERYPAEYVQTTRSA